MARKPASGRGGASTPPTKSERTRERLISAAAATLSRLGYAGTRLVDVAEEAGLQAPAIYYYFESREQLIEEVVVVGTIRLREHVAAALARATEAGPLERIDVAIDAHLRLLMAEEGFAHAVIRNLSQLPDAIRNRQRVEERPYAAMWRTLFQEARRSGAVRDDVDLELARLLIVGSLNWATEWWTPRRGSLDTVVATAQSMVRAGIQAR